MKSVAVQKTRNFRPIGSNVLRRMALERQLAAQELGRNLARLRVRLNLTQEEAAKRIGVTHRAYQRWESGEAMPYPRNIQRIAEAFGITLGEVYSPDAAVPGEPDLVSALAELTSEVSALRTAQERLLSRLEHDEGGRVGAAN